MSSLKKRTSIAIVWNFADQIAKRGISIVVTLLLARFLVPEDFGLLAMMAVFLNMGTFLLETGFKEALIRIQPAIEVDFNTAFYASIVLGLTSYGLLFATAPLIADFYKESRLIDLIRVASLAIIINSFQVIQSAVINRNLNFKVQLKATVPASIISGLIAVSMAYYGYGVWALISQILVLAALTTTFLWMMKLWRPTLEYSNNSLKKMLGFSGYLIIAGFSEVIFINMYVIVIAKYFSTAIAGYYFFADKIKDLVVLQVVTSIQNVTYPALSQLQDDPVRLKSGFRKVISITTFLLFPAMALLAALAEPLFRVLLSEQWLPAVIYLQLLSIAAILYPLHAINLNILKVVGRSDLIMYLSFLKKIIIIVIFVISLKFGIIGILIGQIIGSILSYIPNSYFSAKLINYPIREQLADFIPCLLLSLTVATFTYVLVTLNVWPDIIKLLVFGVLSVLLYLVGAHFFKLHAYILIKEMVVERLKKR